MNLRKSAATWSLSICLAFCATAVLSGCAYGPPKGTPYMIDPINGGPWLVVRLDWRVPPSALHTVDEFCKSRGLPSAQFLNDKRERTNIVESYHFECTGKPSEFNPIEAQNRILAENGIVPHEVPGSVAPTPAPAGPAPHDKLSLEKAKSKCASLGFTPGTEKYGTCVLQLSR